MTTETPRFPNIEVQLTGEDGNAFAILGKVRRELRRNDVSDEQIEEFLEDAKSGDYNHLLNTAMNWVTVL